MTPKQDYYYNLLAQAVNEYYEVDVKALQLIEEISTPNYERLNGDEINEVVAKLLLEGYTKEMRDNVLYLRKDPNHDLSQSVLQTNKNVRFSNRLSIGVAIGVGILTLVNVILAILTYVKAR